ncbi:hypothetical protein EON65_40335 [archaeon]|nr:MAG: hypothetical protein EON65_40335 [archaeon]
MECLLEIYDVDIHGFSENSCYVSSHQDLVKYLAIASPKGVFHDSRISRPLTFILNAKADTKVQGNKCVISSTLYKLLGLEYGSVLSAIYLAIEPTQVETITLSYLGYYTAFHWDEYPDEDPNQCPNTFVSAWPNGLSVAAYTQLLPSSLRNWVFVSSDEGVRGGLVLPALSVHMVSEHILEGY